MFEVVFTAEARSNHDALDADEQAQVDLIVRLLELNPWSDGTRKFTVRLDRWTAGLYDDGNWELVYRILDDRFIEIAGIRRITS